VKCAVRLNCKFFSQVWGEKNENRSALDMAKLISRCFVYWLRYDVRSSLRSQHAAKFYARKQLLLSARLSHRNSMRLSVRPFVTRVRVDQSKTVQARITKSFLSTAWKTLVSGTVKLFHKFERKSTRTRALNDRGGKNLRFLAKKSLYLNNGVR